MKPDLQAAAETVALLVRRQCAGGYSVFGSDLFRFIEAAVVLSDSVLEGAALSDQEAEPRPRIVYATMTERLDGGRGRVVKGWWLLHDDGEATSLQPGHLTCLQDELEIHPTPDTRKA